MAPATQSENPYPMLVNRQTAIPDCALKCIIQGNSTGCPAIEDLACLCQSQPFLSSIETCVYADCESLEVVQQAFDYASYTCSLYGVDIPATTIGASPSSTATLTPAASVPVAPIVDKTQVTSQIDIIMGTVCGVFLAIAFAVGFYGCFKRNRMNKEEASRTQWTQTGSVTSPTFNPTKSYNAFDIPANFDPTRSFGGTAAHQTQSVGRIAIPGLGMRDLTHLDPRDVRMPNEPPRSAFGRSVAFADKDADLFRDDDDDEVDAVDRLRPYPRSSNRDDLLEGDDEITGLGDSDKPPHHSTSTFISNRIQPAESLHTSEDRSEKDDHSPTDSDTRFVTHTLDKGDGRRVSISTTGSDEKESGDIWGRAR